MKTAQFILTLILSFLTGSIVASLLISHSETYKITLPIALLVILFKFILKHDDI